MPDPITAPEPQPNPGAFDPEAFMTKMLAEMDKRTNATDKKFNALLAKLEAKPEPKPEGGGDPKPGEGDPTPAPQDARNIAELNANQKRMARQIEEANAQIMAWQQKAEAAEKAKLESERMSAIDSVLSGIEFASPKARQQFRDAYAGKVERDEDGALIVRTDRGEPLPFNTYLTAEAESSPHFLAAAGKGGAGATGGKKSFGGSKVDILGMTAAEISKLPAEQRTAAWHETVSALR